MPDDAGRPAAFPGVRIAGLSDIGRLRPTNEDSFALLPERGLAIVSDGLGGRQAGAIASRIVVEILPRLIDRRLTPRADAEPADTVRALHDAILDLSAAVRDEAAGRPDLAGMGATVVLALARAGQAFIAHLGDSRAYLHRDARLERLTEDHSVSAILRRLGGSAPPPAPDAEVENRLSRFVGMDTRVYPAVRTIELHAGDRILLCTDGLTGMVGDDDIARILREHADPQVACAALVQAAIAAGGRDNVTVAAIDAHEARFLEERPCLGKSS